MNDELHKSLCKLLFHDVEQSSDINCINCIQSSDINCPIPPAHCMLGLLACSEACEFGQLGTGLSWFR